MTDMKLCNIHKWQGHGYCPECPSPYEGVFCSEYCPRGRDDCKSIAQIIAADHFSFICVGENDGTNREVPTDIYRECFKNDQLDRLEDVDRRDLQHAAGVIGMALAVISELDDTVSEEPSK